MTLWYTVRPFLAFLDHLGISRPFVWSTTALPPKCEVCWEQSTLVTYGYSIYIFSYGPWRLAAAQNMKALKDKNSAKLEQDFQVPSWCNTLLWAIWIAPTLPWDCPLRYAIRCMQKRHGRNFSMLNSLRHSILYTLYFTLRTLLLTLRALHFTLCTLHPVLYTLPSKLYTLHSTHCTLHFTLHTLHSKLYTPHCSLYTLDFILYTPHSTLDTPPPALDTAHFTLHSLHLTLYTSHCTLYAPHSTLYSPHSTLQTLHFHALHVTLHFRPAQLCTFHTLRCMEPWPSLIFMLRAHTGLLSPASIFSLQYFFPRFQRPTPMPKVDLWSFPNYLSVCWLCWHSPAPSGNSTQSYVLSSSSPTSSASIRRFGCAPYLHAIQTCSLM